MKPNELAKISEFGQDLPAYLQEDNVRRDANAGRCEDDSELRRPPRLKLLHGTSSEVTTGQAQPGQYWSQAHGRAIGGVKARREESLDIEPIFFVPLHTAQEFTWFNEQNELEWRTTNPDDQRVKALGEERFRAKTLHLLMLAPVGRDDVHPMPLVYSFRSIAHKVGANWYNEMAIRPAAGYCQVYRLGIGSEERKGHRFWVPRISWAGFAPEEIMRQCAELYRQLATMALTVDFEESNDEETKAKKTTTEQVDDSEEFGFSYNVAPDTGGDKPPF